MNTSHDKINTAFLTATERKRYKFDIPCACGCGNLIVVGSMYSSVHYSDGFKSRPFGAYLVGCWLVFKKSKQ